MPGLAKTKLVETLGIVVGLDALRVQFTPDLMPTDILGSEVMEEGHDGKRGFRFIRGPIFAQLLMADEINRASPRTQSALLQAMQEHHVTVAGARHDLPRPFHVLATQNPLEQEGAYPLPEAQLDRFLLQIDVGYPDRAAERRILIETTGEREARPKPVMTAEDLMAAQRLVRSAPIGDRVVEAILDLVRAGRPGEGDPELTKGIGWGPGPRAAQALMLAARARALVDGRLSPSLDDIADAGGAGAQAPDGAELRRPRRGRDDFGGDRAARRQDDPMTPAAFGAMTLPASIRRDAATLSARLPSLIIAARRVAQTVRHGVHGRRRAGSGETFWQFRPFLSGEPSSRVDWRRSAREERAFVREREWEAAHTVWIWFDRSASMQFASSLAPVTKIDRAALLALAFADLCVRGGERARICSASPGRWRRKASSSASPRRSRPTSVCTAPLQAALPPALPAAPRSMVLLIGDFLSEPEDVARAIQAVSAEGAIGELVMIVDPIEETYPFSGNTEFLHPAGALSVLTPAGAKFARRLSRAPRRASRNDPGGSAPARAGA